MTTTSRNTATDRFVWLQLPRDLPRWSVALMLGAIVVGVLLRLYQYTADASLWLDELALVNNLAERSLWSLLREPLAYSQVAPAGFVVFEKIAFALFGANDHALRAYSFLAGVASLGLIGLVALRLGLREMAWVAPMLLALSGAFVFQSVQVKPYAGDAFFALALIALTLRLHDQGDAPRAWPAAFGALAPWFSFPAAFVLTALGALLLLSERRRRLLPVVIVWGMSTLASVVYASAILSSETATMMQQFWIRGGAGFPPSFGSVFPWLLAQLKDHLWSDVGLRGVTLWLGVVAVGAVALWRRNRFGLAVVASPILVAVVAALLQRYPLGTRLSLWIAALLMLLLAVAAEAAAVIGRRVRLPALAMAPGFALMIFPIARTVRNAPPYRVDHVKPVLAAIAAQRQPNDWLYVYPGAWHAYRYYGALTGIPPERVVVGRCPRKSERESLLPIDAFRGDARVWVLFAHVSRSKDRRILLEYLDHIGTRRASVTYPNPYVRASSSVDAHLYDLSDREKLRRATSGTFPIALGDVPNEHLTCLFGMVPREAATVPVITSTGDVVRD